MSPRSSDHSHSGTDVESDRVVLDDNRVAMMLFGERNANLKRIEIETNAKLHSRGNELTLMGSADAIAQARRLVEQLYRMARSGRPIGPEDVGRAADVLRGDASANLQEVFSDTILVGSHARPIAPKGLAQKRYVDAIRERDIVFAIGPAGTGKTYLAMALALRELLEKRVKRIVLTRPAIEAGERLGFLPGTMEDKVSPYLRPLYDALHDMVDFDRAQQLMERGMLEIAPHGLHAWAHSQRFFRHSRRGAEHHQRADEDVSYPPGLRIEGGGHRRRHADRSARPAALRPDRSGSPAQGCRGIAFCYFTEVDVVRHPLVAKIIRAYERKRAEDDADQGGWARPAK